MSLPLEGPYKRVGYGIWNTYPGGGEAGLIASGKDSPFSDSVLEPTLTLLATAPDLWKALEALVSAHDEEPSMLTEEKWDQARKALQKARGAL